MTSAQPSLAAALAGRYSLERELGAGGMSTVWLAEDVRHHRRVAIKVLHPELSAMLGPERFLKEIELTASLQHAHILPLFDSGSADGLLYYVMPFVDGETLRARLERERQLPVSDAVRIAAEVADALEYAHERGVIHRDVKPENILLQNGHALVADFGIALAVEQAGGSRLTQTGLSLGTPQYMAPEQAMGEARIDGRADVYALGAVTYEMLAGEAPFTGPNAQAIIARAMTESPRLLGELRRTVPPQVEHAVHTALEKLPADRFPTPAAFGTALAGTAPLPFGGPTRSRQRRHVWRPLALATATGALLGAGMVLASARWWRPAPDSTPAPVHFRMVLPSGQPVDVHTAVGNDVAISPDGRRIVYLAVSSVERQLVERDLADPEPRPVPGTEGADFPTFSPDGQWVAFVAAGELRKVELASGHMLTLCHLPRGPEILDGMSWGDDGTILFVQGGRAYRVASGGGAPAPLRLARPRRADGHPVKLARPEILPGGATAIVLAYDGGGPKLQLLSLRTGARSHVGHSDLLGGAVAAKYAAPGYLLVQDQDLSVSAVPFDARRGMVRGTPIPLLRSGRGGPNGTSFAVSRTGVLVYVPAGTPRRSLVLVDRTGAAKPVPLEPGAYESAKFSPDGHRIAFTQTDEQRGARDIWVLDLERGSRTRLTFQSDNFYPVWTPAGDRIAFASRRGSTTGRAAPFWIRADGTGTAEQLVNSVYLGFPSSFTPDGKTLLFRETLPATGLDIVAVPVGGTDHTPRAVLATPASELSPMLSPDGRLLAYVSDESGRNEIYVRSYPDGGGRWQISLQGGTSPLWRRDGREIYFVSGEALYAVPVDPAGDPPRFGRPMELFTGQYVRNGRWTPYDVAPDGRHFLMVQDDGVADRIDVVTGWPAMLRAAPSAGKASGGGDGQ